MVGTVTPIRRGRRPTITRRQGPQAGHQQRGELIRRLQAHRRYPHRGVRGHHQLSSGLTGSRHGDLGSRVRRCGGRDGSDRCGWVTGGEQAAVGRDEAFQVVGVDKLGRGAPVPERDGQLSEVAQAGGTPPVRPCLELADPIVRKPRPRMVGVVPLGELPLGPAQGVSPRHPGAQVELASHLGGDLADGAPVAAHPLAQLVTLRFRGVPRSPGHRRSPPFACCPDSAANRSPAG